MASIRSLALLVIVSCALAVAAADVSWSSLGKLNHFVKVPAQAHGLHTSGRLTERQIAYIGNAGYKSLLSTAYFSTNDTSFKNITDSFPSSDYEAHILTSAPYNFKTFAQELAFTIQDATLFSETVLSLPKPVLIHCRTGYSATFFTLLHLARTGAIVPSDIFTYGLQAGFDYQTYQENVDLVNTMFAVNFSVVAPSIETILTSGESSYTFAYWPHRFPAADNWYTMGQVLSTQVADLVQQNYRTIISLRGDQESTVRLPTDPATGAIANHEFSDSQGLYSVALEQQAVSSLNATFIHLPVSGANEWSSSTFFQYLNVFESVDRQPSTSGAILIHCASGYRSAAYAAAYLAYSQQKCTEFALQQTRAAGFDYAINADDASVMKFFQDVLKC